MSVLKEKYKEEFGVYEGMRIIRENDRYITNTLIFPKQHIKYQNVKSSQVQAVMFVCSSI